VSALTIRRGADDGEGLPTYGTQWLDLEQLQQVQLWDHHVDQTSDIVGANVEVHIEAVGSVTTLIVEKLQQAGVGVVRTPPFSTNPYLISPKP
jgi:nanoRNase/pAp phosphatase (c-di-AMP/oligoRNAs hydrolase)